MPKFTIGTRVFFLQQGTWSTSSPCPFCEGEGALYNNLLEIRYCPKCAGGTLLEPYDYRTYKVASSTVSTVTTTIDSSTTTYTVRSKHSKSFDEGTLFRTRAQAQHKLIEVNNAIRKRMASYEPKRKKVTP